MRTPLLLESSMDVSSVSSSSSPPPSVRAEQPEAPKRAESEQKPREAAKQESEPKPVTNVQGQVTGRVINTSA